jgi:FAD synthetase
MVSPLRSEDYLRVLRRARKGDDLGDRIARALELIQGALDELTEQAIALSFNGGKDCTVLLHLFATALYARHAPIPEDIRIRKIQVEIPRVAQSATTESIPEIEDPTHPGASSLMSSGDALPGKQESWKENELYPPVKSVYITAPNHFSELDDFTDDSVTRYGMDLHRFGGNMKAALTDYLSCGGGTGVRGILVGTRTGDPNGRE